MSLKQSHPYIRCTICVYSILIFKINLYGLFYRIDMIFLSLYFCVLTPETENIIYGDGVNTMPPLTAFQCERVIAWNTVFSDAVR